MKSHTAIHLLALKKPQHFSFCFCYTFWKSLSATSLKRSAKEMLKLIHGTLTTQARRRGRDSCWAANEWLVARGDWEGKPKLLPGLECSLRGRAWVAMHSECTSPVVSCVQISTKWICALISKYFHLPLMGNLWPCQSWWSATRITPHDWLCWQGMMGHACNNMGGRVTGCPLLPYRGILHKRCTINNFTDVLYWLLEAGSIKRGVNPLSSHYK